jgi:hypothetical protein
VLITAIQVNVNENPRRGNGKLYPASRPQGFGKCRLNRAYEHCG